MHSRWRRQFDKVFKRAGHNLGKFFSLKNKLTPYSLTDNAAKALGLDSMRTDDEWMEVLSNPCPHRQFMVEYNWRSFQSNVSVIGTDDNQPTRCGFIFMRSSPGWIAFYVILYPNGEFLLAPGIIEYNREGFPEPAPQVMMVLNHPHTEITRYFAWSHDDRLKKYQHEMVLEFAGFLRTCLSAYAAVTQARLPSFKPADPDAPFRERSTSGKVIELYEVNLYLSRRTIEGEAHYEPKEESERRSKSQHEVRGHWCYQHKRQDPYTCDVPSGHHDWEGDDKRQTCIHCGQKRWFQPSHERGEGELVQKVRNIRA